MNKNKLPKGWKIKTLGDILKISSGNGLAKSKRNDEGEFLVYGGNGITGRHSEYLFEEEKLIIGRVGVHCGNAYITKRKSWVTDNAFVVSFNKDELNKKFLLNLIGVLNLNKYSVSTAQPVISQGTIYPIEIVLPPIETQQAIVSKIEELFSELDKGIEDLKTAQQQLKTYRQSVLKWAFEGKLTNEKVKDGGLPKGWEIVKMTDVIKLSPLKHKPEKDEDLFYIGLEHIEKNTGKLKSTVGIEKIKTVKNKFLKGDLLYGKLRPNLNKVYLSKEEGVCSTDILVLKLTENCLGKYLHQIMLSTTFVNEMAENTSGVNLPRVSTKFIMNYEIPLPTVEEQNLIILEIESRLSVADKMEESIMQSLLQAEALRQSILKKAFSGELV
jgi:type I restriction enzyme S subunit